MKKLSLFFLSLLYLLAINCSSRNDDSTDYNTDYSIVGTWGLTEVTLNGTVTYNGVTTPINTSIPLGVCEKSSRVILSEDGTGSIVTYSSESGPCEKTLEASLTYTYDKNTKVVTMNYNGQISRSTIKSLTNTELIAEETVSNQKVSQFIFTGTSTSKMVKIAN